MFYCCFLVEENKVLCDAFISHTFSPTCTLPFYPRFTTVNSPFYLMPENVKLIAHPIQTSNGQTLHHPLLHPVTHSVLHQHIPQSKISIPWVQFDQSASALVLIQSKADSNFSSRVSFVHPCSWMILLKDFLK